MIYKFELTYKIQQVIHSSSFTTQYTIKFVNTAPLGYIVYQFQYNNDLKMKKKLKISVFDIIHKASASKATPKNANTHQIDSPLVVDKPIRFEDLYKKAIENHHRPGDNSCLKVIYDSKKTTPIQTNRVKKTSVNSIVKNTKSALSSITKSENVASNCITPKASSTMYPSRKNSKQKPKSHSKSRSKPKIAPSNNQKSLKKSIVKPIKIEDCFCFLNHEEHSHLRERNECFLSERQIDFILTKLGFDIKHQKYTDFMSILEVDIYGGAPSQNLKQILKIMQSCYPFKQNNQKRERLPKMIDNNLQLQLTRQNEEFIRRYFADFAGFQNVSAQKQNRGHLANQLSANKIESFESLLRQRKNSTLQLNKELLYNSPGKKINSSAISELIEALTQSQKKKEGQKIVTKIDSANKENQPNECEVEENMNTFRKIEPSSLDNEQSQYNFSRQLSGDKIVSLTQDNNIIQLKNRLNQALKHSQFSHNFQPEQQLEALSSYSPPFKPEQKAILSVDVNLGDGVNEKIIVYQGETAKQVADRLAAKFTISPQTKIKFEKMLDSHLNTMLWKIEELSEEMLTDRQFQ